MPTTTTSSPGRSLRPRPRPRLIFPAFIPFIGETESIAREKQAFHNELADPISGLITLSVHTDHDFSPYDLDAPVEDVEVPGTQGLFDTARRRRQPRQPDAARHRQVVRPGRPAAAVRRDGLAGRRPDRGVFNAGEADGFMVSAAQTPGTFDDFVDSGRARAAAPRLFRTEYTGDTLRDHLGLDPATFSVPPRLRSVAS